jgi:hypothetical protein
MLVRALIRLPLLVWLLAGFASKAAEPPRTPSQRVVKLIATSEDVRFGMTDRFGRGTGTGRDADAPAYVVVAPPEGGKPHRLTVIPEFRRRLASLDRGDLVTLTLSGAAGDLVTAINKFEGPRALKASNTYLFDGFAQATVKGQARQAIKLSKFGTSTDALLPTRASIEGFAPQPDEAFLNRVNAFKPGDLVEVEFAPSPTSGSAPRALPVLADISAPAEPHSGDFVKQTALKDAASKSLSAIVLNVDGAAQTLAMPANPAVATLVRRLKPGNGVTFTLAPGDAQPPALRDLRVEGRVEPTGEKTLSIHVAYARIDFSEARRFRGGGGGGDDIDVNYRPAVDRSQDTIVSRGVSRALESDADIQRLKLTPAQVSILTTAADTLARRRDERAAAAEKTQWLTAYRAWFDAPSDAARLKVEQEMLLAAQELSGRWRKELQDALTMIRTTLNSDQLEPIRDLGREERQDRPRTRGQK